MTRRRARGVDQQAVGGADEAGSGGVGRWRDGFAGEFAEGGAEGDSAAAGIEGCEYVLVG